MNLRTKYSIKSLKKIWYVPILLIAMGIMMIRTLLMARLLSIEAFGEFSFGLLVSSSFNMLNCLGLQIILQRDLPMMILRHHEKAGALLLSQCLIVSSACGCLIFFIIFITNILAFDIQVKFMLAGLLHGLAQQIFLIATTESRSRGQPVRYSLQYLAKSSGIIAIGGLIASTTGSAFLTLVAETLVVIITIQKLLVSVYRNASIKFIHALHLAIRKLPNLQWKASIWLFLASSTTFLMFNIDRWIASHTFNKADFGLYTFAGIILIVGQMIQSLVNTTVFPMLVRHNATFGKVHTYFLSLKISGSLFFAWAMLSIAIWLIMNYGFIHIFPKYQNIKPLLPWFMVIASFRIAGVWSSFLIIIGNNIQLFILKISTITCSILLWTLYIYAFHTNIINLTNLAAFSGVLSICDYLVTMAAAWQTTYKREPQIP
ncbi:lipopolysaccharide biosynthesis protein [Acaryochloris marina NIES-2412]|uniref:lipopolysaccharide biosynthesis protein n=1 Tax=Acaryochloris marina TaxID=155978 RepID=UPI004059D58D